MVSKKDIRAFIDAVKENNEIRNKKDILCLLRFYVGEVTSEDINDVRNW
jgi:hypothetical protein